MKTFKTIQDIREERASLRENKEIYTLLGVILAELDRRSDLTKDPTEQDIYRVIKKLYDAAVECKNPGEEAYLEQFIKKQLTSEELTKIVAELKANGMWNMGECMKHLSTNYAGQYDGKLASQIVRNVLNMN